MEAFDLQNWRVQWGLTQEAASKKFGITPAHYRRLESGKRPVPSYVTIIVGLLQLLDNNNLLAD